MIVVSKRQIFLLCQNSKNLKYQRFLILETTVLYLKQKKILERLVKAGVE